jgi:hypothetical protein
MQPLAQDTAPAAEAWQIAFFQQRSPSDRLALMFDLSAFALAASRDAIRRARPHLDTLAQARFLATHLFGPAHAAQIQRAPNIEGPMSIPAAILPVVAAFTSLRVRYYIGGSVASSAYSLPRTTYDVDIVADMQPRSVAPFMAALASEYYLDRGDILEAITRHSSFNMTHQPTGINIDIFIPQGRPFDHVQFERVQSHMLPGADQPVNLASPEDVLLNKLLWYELGNRVSNQQWRDVQAILRVQADALDQAYLRHWAAQLSVGELLEVALRGERPPAPGADPRQQRLF